jgi:hypothetical protein
MKRLFFFLVPLTILSCKKDKTEESSFPITFYSEKVELASDTRLYTKSGEIKDAQKIAQFIAKISYFNAEQNQTGLGSKYLTFESKDSVAFINNEFKFAVKQSGDQFILTSNLRSISQKPFVDNFRYHLLKYENLVTDGNAEIRKEVVVAYGNYRELKLPVFAYQISSSPNGNGNNLFRLGGLITNEFNEAALPMLGTNDTIAVKRYNIVIKAR